MRNPLRSEAEAFRFLLLTIGYFALIVIGACDQHVGGSRRLRRAHAARRCTSRSSAVGREPLPRTAPATPSPAGEARILVIANETVGGFSPT